MAAAVFTALLERLRVAWRGCPRQRTKSCVTGPDLIAMHVTITISVAVTLLAVTLLARKICPKATPEALESKLMRSDFIFAQ